MDNFGSSEGACGGFPNLQGAGDGENAGGACETVLFTDQDEFLKEIQPDFLANVNPIECGLVDVLRKVEALSSEDEQAIEAKGTRRDKARKLFALLHKIPEEDFASSFVPKLKMEYPHVLRKKEFRLEDADFCSVKCLRHRMMKRIDLKRVVDILPSTGCCGQEEYNRLLAFQHSGEKEWAVIFDLLKRNAYNPQLCQEMKKLLQKKKIGDAGNYMAVALLGFTCTCFSPLQPSAPKYDRTRPERLLSRLKLHDAGSSGTYPSSPISSRDVDTDICTDSGVGVLSIDEMSLQAVHPFYLESFQTADNKRRYREVEDQINTTITVASSVRTEFRDLENIRDDARSLAKRAEDESQLTETDQKLQKLLARAKKRRSAIEELYDRVHKTWMRLRDLENCLDFEVPTDWKNLLRKRHYMLQNEVQECQHFADRAKTVTEQIVQFCRPKPETEESGE